MMKQPWLQVSLSDYEAHLGSPGVHQLAPLSDSFAEAWAHCQPDSLAIVGIAGGNGLARVDPGVTRLILGIDLNPDYLTKVRVRHAHLKGLQLHCLDLVNEHPNLPPVTMVHAALLFEHTGLEPCMENCLSLVAPRGYFVAVLQLPSPVQEGVSDTPYSSMQNLKEHFTLIDPQRFVAKVVGLGCSLVVEKHHPLAAGKAFWMGIFHQIPAK